MSETFLHSELFGAERGAYTDAKQLKRGLLGDGAGGGSDFALVLDALNVVIPLGIGIAVGVIGVSNLLRWLLERYEKATLEEVFLQLVTDADEAG